MNALFLCYTLCLSEIGLVLLWIKRDHAITNIYNKADPDRIRTQSMLGKPLAVDGNQKKMIF
jgi:hypothetical protein